MSKPAPLTPADCDLQDFPFMPLQVARLRDSDLAAEAHPEACWYAVLLWAASWHQLPAASLPNNDTVLMRLIGLGRDVKTFRKHREEMLRGFIESADGRLYHPVVAEQAVAAWESKRQQRWRSECARVKKANQRNGTDNPTPTYEQFLAGMSPTCPSPSPEDVPGDTSECPPGQPLQGTGTGTGRLLDRAKALVVAEAPTSPPATPARRRAEYPAEFEAAWKAYPHVEGRSSKPKALEAWRKLLDHERDGLLEAIGRFRPKVREVCGDRGAPCMARWLRDEKHLNWLPAEPHDVPPDRWAIYVELWRGGDAWPASLGPAPDQPGTRVPASVLHDNIHHLAGAA